MDTFEDGHIEESDFHHGMAFSEFEDASHRAAMDAFLELRRPPLSVREEVDLAYRVSEQSIVVFEDRVSFNDPSLRIEVPIAKATYVRTKNHWKVFWRRGNGKWEGYEPEPIARHLDEFLRVVHEDTFGCFWG